MTAPTPPPSVAGSSHRERPIMLSGKISDLNGRKQVRQRAIVLFLPALCDSAPSIGPLTGPRTQECVGGSGLISLSFTDAGAIVSPRERGRSCTSRITMSFIAGAAMFGGGARPACNSQDVQGVQVTHVGRVLSPSRPTSMVASLLVVRLTGRTSSCGIFPFVGTLVAPAGSWLLPTTVLDTSRLVVSLWMLLVGTGIAGTLSVRTIFVQNTVGVGDFFAGTASISGVRMFGSISGVAAGVPVRELPSSVTIVLASTQSIAATESA